MKVRIGQLEISDVSIEELDELVNRYGGDGGSSPPAKAGGKSPVNPKIANSGGGGHQDAVLLKNFVDGADLGVEAKTVGEILGRRGKATRGAIREWAKRIGLSQEGVDPFEPCRLGTKRAFRIKPSLLEVAKSISGGMKP